jgi:hypothetical protein
MAVLWFCLGVLAGLLLAAPFLLRQFINRSEYEVDRRISELL